MIVSRSSFVGMAILVAIVCAGPASAQTTGAAGTGATASGRVSAPPANSAMRRAGSGTVSTQPVAGAEQGGMATPTNAMTLTSGQGTDDARASNGGSDRQSGAQAPSSVSIDSNGVTRRAGDAQSPR